MINFLFKKTKLWLPALIIILIILLMIFLSKYGVEVLGYTIF